MTTHETPALSKPLPDPDDPVTAPFWAATRQQRLAVPRCAHCGYRFWPPEESCPECLESDFAWEDVPGTGVLWSFAVYHRALDPAFADEIPYAVGLVDLGGGIKMYGIMRGDIDSFRIDESVDAVFEPVTDAVTMVRWRPRA